MFIKFQLLWNKCIPTVLYRFFVFCLFYLFIFSFLQIPTVSWERKKKGHFSSIHPPRNKWANDEESKAIYICRFILSEDFILYHPLLFRKILGFCIHVWKYEMKCLGNANVLPQIWNASKYENVVVGVQRKEEIWSLQVGGWGGKTWAHWETNEQKIRK